MPVIDHLSIYCPLPKVSALVAFYTRILAPLGVVKVLDLPNFIGFGKGSSGAPEFEIFFEDPSASDKISERPRLHFAFIADTRKAVREFYEVGMKEGMKSNGEPGLRKEYTPTYYAAFMDDPMGNRIEAVCQKEEEEGK